ncbi:MAG: hypothetical protein KF886_01880 [Candidatus Hydrogenedentes bacterium]|nr:hypothetical protein [Candidatus Hydrogenedentota bacterium]
MNTNTPDEPFPYPEWMRGVAEIEEQCLSVAAAGLASELGMIDRELIRKSRAAMEAAEAGSVAREETPPYGG